MTRAQAVELMMVRAFVLRDRLRLLFGSPICAIRGHDPALHEDGTLGYYWTCTRCGTAQLLSPNPTG